ncbi:pseudouridylate synthase 1 homolog isoform X1 [Spodoptera frugiperda]|uniref:Pseudouridylate synthase 1 homolog n=2 Tax=Spodoptera frugiperda TaxID=7108 RepID=A0A9R0EQX4_SPOFR|nr:pseudouridylate synthase 1 homolog isoform X1 [Spodoptera frugiperda]
MSVIFYRLFVNTLRQNLPRHPIKSVLHVRSISAMEVATVEKVADESQKESQEIVLNKNLTRFKKRFMKRQWQDPDPNKTENGESDEKKLCERPVERIKRKKMALVLGYCGVDYYGMQRNPGVRTIEEDLLKALLEAKYITEDDFNNQQNTQFQRSSRTDKGVSAARQVVSLKLPLEADINEINKRLPDCIKVFGIKRVTNKFNSKSKCNARTYSYTLPTYVFEPSLVTDEERKQYRISEDKKEQVKKVLEVYKGTKSYHNFTEKKHHQDPSSLRYMMGFTLDRVFVDSDMEFAVLLVKGQSFMLHQIRKMVGLAIAVVRGHTDNSILEKAFGKEKVMIPTAPGLGLVLDTVHYDRYDNKFKDSHDSLTWTSEEEEIQKFKHEHIYPVIVKGEVENSSMAMWLEKLSNHSYEPSEDVPEKIDEKELAGGDDDDDFDEEADDEGDDGKKESKNNSTVVTTAEESNLENGKTDKGTL